MCERCKKAMGRDRMLELLIIDDAERLLSVELGDARLCDDCYAAAQALFPIRNLMGFLRPAAKRTNGCSTRASRRTAPETKIARFLDKK